VIERHCYLALLSFITLEVIYMQNPNNCLVRTSGISDAELAGFNAWCEVCGAKGIYGDMLHDFETDTICCMTEGCYSQIPKTEEKEMASQTVTHTIVIPTFTATGAYYMSVGFFDCQGNKEIIEVDLDTVIRVDKYFAPCGDCGNAILQSAWSDTEFCQKCDEQYRLCDFCEAMRNDLIHCNTTGLTYCDSDKCCQEFAKAKDELYKSSNTNCTICGEWLQTEEWDIVNGKHVHTACLKLKEENEMTYCDHCGKGQHPDVAWEATETGWEHLDCIEMANYCADCDGTSDTGCVVICEQKKGERMFKISGFHYVTAAGMMEFWQLLEEKGSIDLLWDMKPITKINALMQSENFDTGDYVVDHIASATCNESTYDDIMFELNDEMIDAITALEFAFTTNQTAMHFNGRSIENLDCIPSTNVWNPNVYYPITGDRIFTDRADMEKFVSDYFTIDTTDYDVVITITAHPVEDGDYDCDQVIPFHITGACEYNLMMDLCNILDGEGYILVFTCNK